MNKLMPYFLVLIFGVIVTTRFGYVAIEYYSDSFKAEAKEPKDILKTTPTPKTTATLAPAETVNDRLMKESNEDIKKNRFAEKIARHADIKNPQDKCITGIMLKDALKKLAYLDTREAKILEQQKLLEISDRRIREQVAKLKLIKNEIIESAQLADSSIAKENKRLISIYEKMKPKDAANIFNEMQPNVAAELLRTMKEDQSSQILSKMLPKNAHDVTLSLAGGIKKTEKQYDDLRQQAE